MPFKINSKCNDIKHSKRLCIYLYYFGNKMFNQLLNRNERQIKLRKCMIYRQMLDHQILLNKCYKIQQLKKSLTPRKHTSAQPRDSLHFLSSRKQKMENNQYAESFKKSINNQRSYLPVLRDKNIIFRGESNFIAIDPNSNTLNRKRNMTEPIFQQTKEQDDLNQSIDKLLGQLKVKKRDIFKQAHRRRLSQISPINDLNKPSLRSHRIKEIKGVLNNSMQKTNEAAQSISPENQQTIKNPEINMDKNDEYSNQKTRFVQILRKVRNRGQSLYLKLSKYPKQ